MNRPLAHVLLLAIATAAALAPAPTARAADRPNVLLILADDLGVGDLRAYAPDSKVPTPNLDKLAAGGTRFTNAYCPVSVCSPTRYALMTGRYPWKSWKKNGVLANWDRPMIEPGRLTLPAMLRKAGYATAGLGKWHLGATYKTTDGKPPAGLGQFKSDGTGANIDIAAPVTGGPTDRGFDTWYGFVCASEMLILDQDKVAGLLSHSLYAPPAVPGANDLPKVTVAGLLPLITDKGMAYLNERAKHKDQPFLLYYAPYVPHIPLAVGDDFRGKTRAGDYGDYVHQLDHEIGRLLAALDQTGLAKDTLVIFASDNGSEFQTSGDGHKPNGGLRGRKHHIYEAGIRTPLVARWPGRVPAGATTDQLVALNDWLATLAALTGQTLPPGAGEDSISFLPALLGQQGGAGRAELLMQASAPRFALRRGNFKWIQPAKKGEGPGELYDLAADPAEAKDLAAEKPDLAAEMKARLIELVKK